MPRMPDPVVTQIRAWHDEAAKTEPNDPTAMALATASPDGWPSVRMVLLKSVDADGFVFYTNKESQKGEELAANPKASLLFHWKTTRRQIRVTGTVSHVSDTEADAYFASRPRQSQLGAIVSQQSRPMADRAAFEAEFMALRDEYGDERPIERPAYWGGYHIDPVHLEFWIDRPYRLHERQIYRWDEAAQNWSYGLVYP